MQQIIFARRDAPAKPEPGAPCNGCGVCCLLEPCPLGRLLSGRRRGACVALRWLDDAHRYRCGALCAPVAVLHSVLPRRWQRWAKWLAPGLAPMLAWWARRWIALGQGCDSSVEASALQAPNTSKI